MRRCPVCDVDLDGRRACPNYWCNREDRGFDVVWAVGDHRGELRQAIAALKYRDAWGRADQLGAALAAYMLERAPCFEDVDLIVGVPPSPGRDHVGRVVRAAAARIGHLWRIPDRPVITKRAPTRPLIDASDAASRRLWAASDLRQSLVVIGRLDAGRVLVVDDVLTDGSTLREAARALRIAGAGAVSGLVLARQPLTAGAG